MEARKDTLGGSDVAALVGANPWKTSLDLYLEKTGEKTEGDVVLSNNDAVAYGNDCEPIIRCLFVVNHPEIDLDYEPHNIWYNDKYPFASASLDGWLVEKDTGRRGIFEAKTSTIRNRAQREKWDGQIPQNYYCQVLWYMAVTETDFVWLNALLRTAPNESVFREYHIERKDCEEDIALLLKKAEEFWDCLKNGQIPNVPLPKI